MSLLYIEEDPGNDGKFLYYGDGLLGSGDDEVRESHVWKERGGETCSVASEVCMEKGVCECLTAGSPGTAKMQAQKEMAISMLNTLLGQCVSRTTSVRY